MPPEGAADGASAHSAGPGFFCLSVYVVVGLVVWGGGGKVNKIKVGQTEADACYHTSWIKGLVNFAPTRLAGCKKANLQRRLFGSSPLASKCANKYGKTGYRLT